MIEILRVHPFLLLYVGRIDDSTCSKTEDTVATSPSVRSDSVGRFPRIRSLNELTASYQKRW